MCFVESYRILLTTSIAILLESNNPLVIGASLRSTFISSFFLFLWIRSIIVPLTYSSEPPYIVLRLAIKYL